PKRRTREHDEYVRRTVQDDPCGRTDRASGHGPGTRHVLALAGPAPCGRRCRISKGSDCLVASAVDRPALPNDGPVPEGGGLMTASSHQSADDSRPDLPPVDQVASVSGTPTG